MASKPPVANTEMTPSDWDKFNRDISDAFENTEECVCVKYSPEMSRYLDWLMEEVAKRKRAKQSGI